MSMATCLLFGPLPIIDLPATGVNGLAGAWTKKTVASNTRDRGM